MTAWLLRRWAPIAALAAGLLLYLKGRSDASAKAAAKDAAAYRDTRKDMDDAQDDVGILPDDARRWLRDRADGRSCGSLGGFAG